MHRIEDPPGDVVVGDDSAYLEATAQRAQNLTSISTVLASNVAHGTFEVAAKSRPPPMRLRCLADRTFGIGTSAPSIVRASIVAEMGNALGTTGGRRASRGA